MLMPGRRFTTSTYRYGFNGKENDNNVKGEGNEQDYGFRIYNTRLGRFLSIDPLTRSYPMLTPFQFASNSPVKYKDLDGLEAGPDESMLLVNSDDPEVRKRFSKSPVGKGAHKVADVFKGVFKSAFYCLAAFTEMPAAMHYGNKVQNKQEVFPLTHADLGYTAQGMLIAPASLALNIKNDPTNGEYWGEAIFMFAPIVKSRLEPARMPFSPEFSRLIDFQERGRVFRAGGSIGILEGRGELNVNVQTMTIDGSFTSSTGYPVIFDAKMEVGAGNTINLKNVSIYLDLPEYFDSKTAQNLIGRSDFLQLQSEISSLVEGGGYKPGNIQYYRRPPEGSTKPSGETIEVPLKRN